MAGSANVRFLGRTFYLERSSLEAESVEGVPGAKCRKLE